MFAPLPSKLPLAIALVALLVLGPACDADGTPKAILTIESEEDVASLEVEIADDERERARGLMGRTELAEDAGMVFLFDEPNRGGFWMKDTLIPLSIAYWDEEGRIVSIIDMEPCPEDPCPLYDPGRAYVGAVEANVGWFREHGVEVGDRVELERR